MTDKWWCPQEHISPGTISSLGKEIKSTQILKIIKAAAQSQNILTEYQGLYADIWEMAQYYIQLKKCNVRQMTKYIQLFRETLCLSS